MARLVRFKTSLSKLSVLVTIALTGCANPKIVDEQDHTGRFALKVEAAEENIVGSNLGLALSGGGIRSALFNLGVLKWLYDAKLLDQVDIISSVSGGGYTAYWMYANHFSNPAVPRFGYNSFDQSQFGRSVCNVITTSNFVTEIDMLRAAVLPNLTAPDMYENELGDTFGKLDPVRKLLEVRSLADIPPGSPRVPYYVINATVVDPKPSKGWADGRIELTPLLKGNEHAGYTPWASSETLPLRKAIAISGAAFRPFLKQEITNPLPRIAQSRIVLSDGGHSENLGAIALIRRGVKRVIIADAEHNPRYEFEAYLNLQKRLASWGLNLTVPSIDAFICKSGMGVDRPPLATGFHEGKVFDKATGKRVSTIYYLKMARPDSLQTVLDDKKAIAKGHKVNADFYQRLDDTKIPSRALFQKYRWQCDTAIDLNEEMMKDWFKYELWRYAKAADGSAWMGFLRWLPFDFIHSDFPQYSTADQNFNLTQSMAFVALGYYEAEELRPHVAKIGSK